ncbi:MAG: xanthine dehydrogenase molybdopterin binding subunit [Gammaproteobacteria bacterium]|nr:xanthine dehydrogenase molybdopterin binding subunit [Gammaproteobacteria bacterium]MDH3362843.1 xanthine dehydrogenase molybdopterin binding subunit [Gammaproteobacteria bacterium]MDH3480233.1 xanthine dehydrogenase molybdopterin binding subunit [Gammaproteobacteria bacterium]
MDASVNRGAKRLPAVGQALPHDSAHLHVTGSAAYTDDLPEPRDLLHLAVGMSQKPHAKVIAVDLADVLDSPGVVDVCLAGDIPGRNNYGAIVADDPVFADGLVQYVGQPVFAVAATTVDEARKAARKAIVEYEELEAILDPLTAVEKRSFVLPSETLVRGDPDSALENAAHRVRRRVRLGGQDQFYLEGHIAMAIPQEAGGLLVYSSTQHPDEVQSMIAQASNRPAKDIVVICRRMGGAFGGKESQAALIAVIAAIAADKTGRPCKLRLDRDDDMIMTGKRHDFVIDYEVGFDDTGRILGIDFEFASRCGMSADLSGPVNDRAMFHCDNAYYLENVRIVSHRCKTNTVSNTAFRGFGGPQGMFAAEYVIEDIASALGKDPLEIRRRNFYGKSERNVTQYQQTVDDNIIGEIFDKLVVDSDYEKRRAEIRTFNAESKILRRGISITPVKFGISFTNTLLNQAGALVHVYKDGTVQLNHGGTEMGQGLYVKVAQIVADEFQIGVDRIRSMAADTSKVPNASATAASSGSDMNGKAAQMAAAKIRRRLTEFAARHFSVSEASVEFSAGRVYAGDHSLEFAELVRLAWADRVSLSAAGFYKTPKINYDRKSFSGRPFFYFAYGAAVTEVVVDRLTGEHRVLRVDILHDCGDSLNPAVDLGQVEGGYIQGVGWLTTEELWWNDAGELGTHSPSTYKIPTCSDLAPDFRVELMQGTANREDTVYRSKAVGEPPLMLSLSAFHAIRDAIGESDGLAPDLRAPATPEAVLRAIQGRADE